MEHWKPYSISNTIKDLFQYPWSEPFFASHWSTIKFCVGNFPPQNCIFMQSGIQKDEIENSDCNKALKSLQYIQPYQILVLILLEWTFQCALWIHNQFLCWKFSSPKLFFHAIWNSKRWNRELWLQWSIDNSTVYPNLSKTCSITSRMNLSLCLMDPQSIFVLEIFLPKIAFLCNLKSKNMK